MSTLVNLTARADEGRVESQGGIIEGANPTEYNPKDPIILFIIQASFIIILCHLLHWPLSKIRQPRVIAEVIGGIILGPSVMGRIPGFTDAIFPSESIPGLTLVANLGLVLYLFMIGLETDVRFLVENWRIASAVAFAGLALPFALGCALAWGLYNEFRTDAGIVDIEFTTYMLFIGVAIAITAFPVLCRILTELNLLGTTAGIVTLSAGVANDVIGWILLALCVTLANSGDGLSALWILLTCFGYLLFLIYAVKPVLYWLLDRTGNLKNGPSQVIISLILLIAIASAFFTGILGVHPIFGGFMAGLIVPRDMSFAIKVTEKLEDLIGALFLPLYFTLSGLNTNLGLLDNGITWAYIVAVTLTAFFSKIIGATLAARLSGIVWRESFTIGALMSCKGLVELIVLNIGLQAKILSQRTFTIFVVMALVTTFTTTPLTTFLYPPWYQKKLEAWKRGEIDWDSGEPNGADSATPKESAPHNRVGQLLVYLRLDSMPGLLGIVALFGQDIQNSSPAMHVGKEGMAQATPPKRHVRAHGLRLLQLGDRDSSVMTVSEVEQYTKNDPIVNMWRMVGQILKVSVSGEVATMLESRFSEALLTKSSDISSDLLLLPWSGTGHLGDSQAPFSDDKIVSSYISFTNSVLSSTEQNIAILLPQSRETQDTSRTADRLKLHRAYSFSDIHHDVNPLPVKDKARRIVVPFFGGSDDRLALMLALQFCEREEVSARILHIMADNAISATEEREYLNSVIGSLSPDVASRVEFIFAPSNDAGEELVTSAIGSLGQDSSDVSWDNLVVVGRHGSAGKLSLGVGKAPLEISDELVGCIGYDAGLLISSGIKADLLVVQAKSTNS
ncbi:Kef-type K+ transport system, membrane component KefB [Geosmithia morbida]|uniref:Kef-type K+ transport system, membrane component KefB n=1 Tax=Geosmithia morbida TaxID=1094350 RepID=A0A9P4YTA7_9HYPO|nr:Kef-type K+ transport system, membrane component KefB [Geosmithia morbida]KAF4121389.1 Kef-type K+ transport system, membrane component KefB [Geosmithia morbida]